MSFLLNADIGKVWNNISISNYNVDEEHTKDMKNYKNANDMII